MRSPRRTAQTSSALMVGLALVSAIAVFGASLSRSATSSVDNAISADLIVTNTSSGGGSGGFSTTVPLQRLASRASPPRQPSTAASSSSGTHSRTFSSRHPEPVQDGDPEHDGGSSAALTTGDLLVDTSTANADHLTVARRCP